MVNSMYNDGDCKPKKILWPFWTELAFVIFLPFMVWHANTPTNILNSSEAWKLLETIGLLGDELFFFFGIPLGVIGIVAARKMNTLRTATKVISIVNLSIGSIEVILVSALFCLAFFGGISV